MNARFAGWLAHPLPLHPFLYPPHYLLAAAAVRRSAADAFAAVVSADELRADGRGAEPAERQARRTAAFCLSALLSPAAAIAVWLGQNSFLTAALLVGGFALAKRRPLLAGFLLGVLTYKPQFWLMVPIALIAARQWKTLAAALGSAGSWR